MHLGGWPLDKRFSAPGGMQRGPAAVYAVLDYVAAYELCVDWMGVIETRVVRKPLIHLGTAVTQWELSLGQRTGPCPASQLCNTNMFVETSDLFMASVSVRRGKNGGFAL